MPNGLTSGRGVFATVGAFIECRALGRLISSQLYGLTVAGPTAIAIATLIILTATALAGYVPTRRASQIDPMVSLRHDQCVAINEEEKRKSQFSVLSVWISPEGSRNPIAGWDFWLQFPDTGM